MMPMNKNATAEIPPANASFSSLKFCHYIAHELASPLTGMLASIEAIERQLDFNLCAKDGIEEMVGILRSETTRLTMLLKELRSSRVLMNTQPRPTSLATQITELLHLQSAYYAERHIKVDRHIALDLPLIVADRDKLRQALLNICNNAVEAMPEGGTLTFRSYAIDEWACLDISDTGDGIPEDLQVFEPGITTKARSSGIGLTIVREIIKQHGGAISYVSRLGSGTTFHLKFLIYDERETGASGLSEGNENAD